MWSKEIGGIVWLVMTPASVPEVGPDSQHPVWRGLAARRAPDDPKTLYLLADSLSTAPEGLRDPELALGLAEKALDLEPGNGMTWQSLGWARYRAGDWDGCIESLEKQDSYPGAGDFFAAMAHWRRGDRDKAREVFGRTDRWLAGYEKRWGGKVVYPYPSMLRRIRAEAAALLGVGPAPDESRPQPALGPSGPPE